MFESLSEKIKLLEQYFFEDHDYDHTKKIDNNLDDVTFTPFERLLVIITTIRNV